MLKLQETSEIEGLSGVQLSFELTELLFPVQIDNEAQAYVEFILHGDLGDQ